MKRRRLSELKQVMRWSDNEFDEFLDELRIELKTPQSKSEISFESTEPINAEEVVTDFLTNMGVPAHIKGYKYLKSAILYTLTNPNALETVTKGIYPYVAQQHNTTWHRVERAIRHAVEVATDRNRADSIYYKVFGASINPAKGKPTNSEFIAASVDYLRIHYFSK